MTQTNDNYAYKSRRSHIRAALTVLIITLVGPSLGLVLWAIGLVLAPPWTLLTGEFYLLLACAGLPLGMVAVWIKRLKFWGFLATLGLTGVVTIFLLAIVGLSGLPTGMTNCQPLDVPPPHVRYNCVSTSSDDANFRYEFTLAGRVNWPVLRIVNSKLTR